MSPATSPNGELTNEEISARVGAIPLWRVRQEPAPGTATEADVERVRRQEDQICELLDGVLVAKVSSEWASALTAELVGALGNVVRPKRLGWILGPDGAFWLTARRLRTPDISYVRRDQRPDGRPIAKGYADIAPLLAVEVFSDGNSPGEMKQKRDEFFSAGTELFWIVYPERQEIVVSTDPQTHVIVDREGTLDGGAVLPGFSVRVGDIFDALRLGQQQ